jgi:hypothetical protein
MSEDSLDLAMRLARPGEHRVVHGNAPPRTRLTIAAPHIPLRPWIFPDTLV